MPCHGLLELGTYLHLVDPNDKDPSDLLAKVKLLVDHLKVKFSDACIPEKPSTWMKDLSSSTEGYPLSSTCP